MGGGPKAWLSPHRHSVFPAVFLEKPASAARVRYKDVQWRPGVAGGSLYWLSPRREEATQMVSLNSPCSGK